MKSLSTCLLRTDATDLNFLNPKILILIWMYLPCMLLERFTSEVNFINIPITVSRLMLISLAIFLMDILRFLFTVQNAFRKFSGVFTVTFIALLDQSLLWLISWNPLMVLLIVYFDLPRKQTNSHCPFPLWKKWLIARILHILQKKYK